MALLKNKYIVLSEDNSEETAKSETKEYSNQVGTNQIYFYDDVTRTSIYNLNRNLEIVSKNLLYVSINYNLIKVPQIDLFISSEGGEIFSAFSAVDRIKSSKVPIHSYVEGIAASAATLLSVVAHKRYIRSNSFMLIHQVSSSVWGNFQQIKEETNNLELLMKYIKNIYMTHTKFNESDLDKLLKQDLYLDAQECLKFGLVDEII
jgi:ATP-dependent Clp protease protease subunit